MTDEIQDVPEHIEVPKQSINELLSKRSKLTRSIEAATATAERAAAQLLELKTEYNKLIDTIHENLMLDKFVNEES